MNHYIKGKYNMAVYKNREVEITSIVTDENPMVEIMHKDGTREQVRAVQVQVTKDEQKEFAKQHAGDKFSVIEDKDLKDLRDSQDPEKIKKEQEKNPQDQDVTVNKIKVPADQIKQAK